MAGAALTVVALAPAWADQSASTAGSDTQLSEVIVSATHTGDTDVQKTPIPIDVVGGAQLTEDNLRTLTDLPDAVPSLQITHQAQNPEVYLRGVGGNNGNSDDTDVGIYLDGVYLSRPFVIMYTDFNDLDRVEVVEGPQGTLFGRNTAGGAINFISRPAPKTFEFQDTFSYGNYDLIDEAFRVGGPLADNVQASLSYSHVQHDGYQENVNPGVGNPDAANRTGWRGQVHWDITSDISTTLRADYLDTSENWVISAVLASPFTAYPDPLANSTVGNLHEVDMNHVPILNEKDFGISDEINWKFNDNLSLKSLTAHRIEHTLADGGDTLTVNHSALPTDVQENETTQEFNLINHFGPLSGVIGYFYFNENYNFLGQGWFDFGNPSLSNFGGEFYQITIQPTTSQAVFFNETYQITQPFGITVGGRYTSETKGLINTVNYFTVGNGLHTEAEALASNPALAACVAASQPCGGNYVGNLSKTFTHFSPKVSLNLQATPDTLLYVSATNGYKSGGYNFTYADQSAFLPPGFGPETIWDYEIGAKSDLFDHALRLNAAVFRYQWTALQFASLVAPAVSTTANAGDAHLTGVELNATVKPARGWLFTGGLTWLSSRYDNFNAYSVPGGLSGYLAGNPNFNAAAGSLNATGNQLAGAPNLSLNITGQRDFYLQNGGDLFVRASYEYVSQTYFDPSNVPINSRPAYSLVNASGGYGWGDGRWQVALWGKNLTNKVVPSGFNAGSPPDEFYVSDPRTYGVRINFRY
jgi:iron complex outermembrane receptor protein